jgi:hypothetical protein
MAKRGTNHFRRTDAARAVRAARDAGLNPAGIDVIVGKDGSTTFRVFGSDKPSDPAAQEWDQATAAIEKSKKATKQGRRREAR